MTDEPFCMLCTDHGHRTRDCPHRDGRCPMCGEWYKGYVNHLQRCEGGHTDRGDGGLDEPDADQEVRVASIGQPTD